VAEPTSVLHLTRSAWPVPGGMEASIEGLARAQAAAGMEVVIGCLRGHDGWAHGVRRVRLPRRGPRRYPFAAGLGPLLAAADVVHVHGLDGLADQVVGRHPAVGISTHGGFLHTSRQRALKQLWLRGWTRRTLRRAGAVWFSSASDREGLGAGVEGIVLGDGVAVASPGVRCPVPGRWVVPGRIDVHKGIDDLLELLRVPVVRARVGEIRVVGPEARPGLVAALRRQAGDLPVCFTGRVARSTWGAELLAAEVAVFPSRHEGFGIAAVEAMAWGIPVVLSDIPPFREHLGGPGVDLRGGDARGFVAALEGAPAAVEARQERVARHRWPGVVARYDEAYRRLLGAP
jgi:glycosyltransferase involved in cell wall biosynthesis